MPIDMIQLRATLNPKQSALLLGAGASIPSGAPSGAELAKRLWRKVAHSEPLSEDFVETASILVRRYNRHQVAEAVRGELRGLKPSGGLLGLPKLGWKQLFTTNFDQLLEKAYKQNELELATIRSNFDFSSKENASEQKLFKIHGCLTQDEAFGDKASMIMTEDDFEKFDKFRQSMFSALQTTLLTTDVLVIGQSLRDRHLHDLVRQILSAKQEGSAGQLYLLIYDADDLRAPLLEDKGARIVFGGIDDLVHSFSEALNEKAGEVAPSVETLPLSIVSTVDDISSAVLSAPNVLRMFNGGPASYSDIRTGVTFERAMQVETIDRLLTDKNSVVAVTGAAGVGKTTFARQVALALNQRGWRAWEHRSDFGFQYQSWIRVEAELRRTEQRGVLLLDECTHYMRATNALVDHLAGISSPALKLIVTANSAQWAPRLKSPNFAMKGLVLKLGTLHDQEIYSLLNLIEHNSQVASLVDSGFKKQRREKKFEALRRKCAADMFVCLKNIFANDNIDIILLQEFDDLDPFLQEYYRFVAALEAIGTRVHRQLVIRMLKINPTKIGAILDGLTGIVDEYDIRTRDGIFGWSTRHLVIARKITEFKFSSVDELSNLFKSVIDNLNPAEPIEIQSVRAICDTEFGIGRIGDAGIRRELYRRLILAAPGERIPWHRLIRELLIEGDGEEAEYAIRGAEAAVGSDGPIARFKVRLLVMRAKTAKGISKGDRLAIMRRAYEQAMKNTDSFRMDKHSYRSLCDVAIEMVQLGESAFILDEAINHMRTAASRILDPDMDDKVREYERYRARMH